MTTDIRAAVERLLQHIDDPIRTPFTRDQAIADVRAALATPPAPPTHEAPPVPQQGTEISDVELDEMAIAAGMDPMHGADDEGPRDYWEAWDHQLHTFARAVWARAQAARPTVAPVPVSEPAADQQEGRDNTDGRDPACVAQWPDCEDGAYDPRCCRFPKSCSCGPRGAGRVQP